MGRRLNGIRTMLRLDEEKSKDQKIASARKKRNIQLIVTGAMAAVMLLFAAIYYISEHLRMQRVKIASMTSDSVIGKNLKKSFSCPNCENKRALKGYKKISELVARCPDCGKNIAIKKLIGKQNTKIK